MFFLSDYEIYMKRKREQNIYVSLVEKNGTFFNAKEKLIFTLSEGNVHLFNESEKLNK